VLHKQHPLDSGTSFACCRRGDSVSRARKNPTAGRANLRDDHISFLSLKRRGRNIGPSGGEPTGGLPGVPEKGGSPDGLRNFFDAPGFNDAGPGFGQSSKPAGACPVQRSGTGEQESCLNKSLHSFAICGGIDERTGQSSPFSNSCPGFWLSADMGSPRGPCRYEERLRGRERGSGAFLNVGLEQPRPPSAA
jgi:hypothetical protein